MCNRAATFSGKGCQRCLPSVLFLTIKLVCVESQVMYQVRKDANTTKMPRAAFKTMLGGLSDIYNVIAANIFLRLCHMGGAIGKRVSEHC